MRSRRVVTAACVLALVTLAGCSDDSEPGSSASTSSSSGSASGSASGSTSAVSSRYPTYVALGDSYTAAPGNPTTEQTTGCSQSDHNYPHLVAEAIGTQLDDVSCSGASTLSLVGAQQVTGGVRPAQFEALEDDTSLVTLGMGGNDRDLFTSVIGTCLSVAGQDAQGSPCRSTFNQNGKDKLKAQTKQIGQLLTAALQGIYDRSPDATVLAIGYPQPIPAKGTCALLPLAAGDYAYARQVVDELNAAVMSAAAKTGATYIDVAAASEGHDICAGDQAWVNGLSGDTSRAILFHPFPEEQQAIAGLIEDALQG